MKQGIIPIPGTTNANHLKENVGALEIKLSDSDVIKLDRILKESRYIGKRYPSKKVSAIYPERRNNLQKSKSAPTLFKSAGKLKRQSVSNEVNRFTK